MLVNNPEQWTHCLRKNLTCLTWIDDVIIVKLEPPRDVIYFTVSQSGEIIFLLLSFTAKKEDEIDIYYRLIKAFIAVMKLIYFIGAKNFLSTNIVNAFLLI